MTMLNKAEGDKHMLKLLGDYFSKLLQAETYPEAKVQYIFEDYLESKREDLKA